MDFDEVRDFERLRRQIMLICHAGFRPAAGWLFVKDGKVYDLSVADLNQLDRIEREGLFVVEKPRRDDGALKKMADAVGYGPDFSSFWSAEDLR